MTERKRRPTRRQSKAATPVSSIPDWTIDIRGFGKIARGSITMAPLVMLVGQNNTGKSYAACLLWALLNFREVGRGLKSDEDVPQWIMDAIEKVEETGSDAIYELTASDFSNVARHIQSILTAEGGKALAELFALPSFDVSKLDLKLKLPKTRDFKARFKRAAEGSPMLSMTTNIKSADLDAEFALAPGRDSPSSRWLGKAVYDFCAADIIRGKWRGADVAYIPAARTGLVLALPSIISELLGMLRFTGGEKQNLTLPVPTVQFLQNVVRKTRAEPLPELTRIAEELESRILGGSVSLSQDEVPNITYQPKGSGKSFPLHATSSMVTELAPFLVMLRSGRGLSALIFEEPEAHLHISAQRTMAIAIANLVTAGIPVVLTTHSDTFVQQINNLLSLYNSGASDKELDRLGYRRSDLLDGKSARAYEFTDGPAGTIIKELEKTENGFIVPSLNDPLMDFAQETMEVQTGLGES